MSEQNTGDARKMFFNTDLASKIKQDQQDVTIENLKAEITACLLYTSDAADE